MENEREQPKRMIGKTQMRTMTSDRVRPALGQGKVVTVHVRTKGTARRHPSHKRKEVSFGCAQYSFFFRYAAQKNVQIIIFFFR